MSSQKRLEEKADLDQQVKCWSNGKFIDGHNMVSSLTAGFHYSLAVWEGIRVYKGKCFKLEEHLHRLYRSAQMVEIPPFFPMKEIYDAIEELVGKFDPELDLYVRPIIYLANAENDFFSKKSVNFDIYVFPIETDSPKILTLHTTSIRRSYPYYNMQIKTPANYWMMNAAKAAHTGCDDVLYQDKDGYVVEATVANLFILKEGKLYTPPADGSILPGITRQTIIDDIYPTQERKITVQDILEAQEAFLCGTYTEIQRIGTVDGYKIGVPSTSDLTETIRKNYLKIVGALPDKD